MGVVPTVTELIDLFWRSFWTGVAAFIGGLVSIGTGLVHMDTIEAAKLAAISAVLTTIKVYASNKIGTGTATSKETPSIGIQPVASNSAVPAGTEQGMK